MIRVLVAYATKMGVTKEIAETIGNVLSGAGLAVEVHDAQHVQSTAGFEAVVIGSAVYLARWRPEAVTLLERHADRVRTGTPVPTWLFHSGPAGPAAGSPLSAPHRVRTLAVAIGAAPPMTFGGRLEPETAKGFAARRMASGPLAGDFRDFNQIRRWSEEIAAQLVGTPNPVH